MKKTDDLETPDFDGRKFTAGEAHDEWPSRAHGWALVLVVILAIVGFYSLRSGAVLTAIVLFAVAGGVLALAAAMIRKELRKFMEYRHRL
jgi:hypothetical protein